MNGYNFTEEVRKALASARQEAARLRHEFVGTEHVLLGLILDPAGTASGLLKSLNTTREAIQQRVEAAVRRGPAEAATSPDLPYSARAKKALELAMNEAQERHDRYVGCEHLLLGLIREEKGIAAQVLAAVGVTLDAARAAVPTTRHTTPPGGGSGNPFGVAPADIFALRRRNLRRARVRYSLRSLMLGIGASAVGVLTADAATGMQQPSGRVLLASVIAGVVIATYLSLAYLWAPNGP